MTSVATDDRTQVLARGSAGALEAPGLELVVVDGVDRGARLRVRGTIRIGTAQGNDLHLTDATVSRVHATLRLDGGRLRLEDMGSTNGTFVDGVRVRDAYVSPGNLVRLAETTLRAEAVQEPLRVELAPYDRLGDLVGASPAMRYAYALIERVAPTSTTVLIQGETGTGKELVARAIHARSTRSARRFLAIIERLLLNRDVIGLYLAWIDAV